MVGDLKSMQKDHALSALNSYKTLRREEYLVLSPIWSGMIKV